ncbi:hypothetical protein [Cohnella abietis]|uniref:Uncharacterized protein n=1 Tax=Cohnella abietis TaxID=2507935 RepID=A0A3T1D3K6_9BACL|nr:hypothetical protein [Cohnella abietis]BBI32693.1 hypothetical protein KCTCHS21_20920 [Cohnella abietis]
MLHREVTKSKQGLLMLVGAVVQLIQTSTAIDLDHMFKREISLLAYHRTKQTELLNQLYEVFLSRINALSTYEQPSPSASDSKELEIMEASLRELLTGLLKKEEEPQLPADHIVLNEPIEAEPEDTAQSKEMTKNPTSPFLYLSKQDIKKTTKQRNKRDANTFEIQIGSQAYKGFL